MYSLGSLFRTQLFFSDDSASPIGRLRMAGTVAASTGIDSRRLDSYAIVLAVAGAGHYSDELGVTREIAPGDLLVLFPGLLHSYGPDRGQRWDEFYLVFDGPIFEFLEGVGVLDRKRTVISLRPFEPILARLIEISNAQRPLDQGGRAMEVLSLLPVLMGSAVPGRPLPTWVDRAASRLGSDLNQDLDMTVVASELGMGYESFRKRFKQATGFTPTEFRNRKRLDTAREMLSSTSLNIREIATNLGYYDEYHLSRRFREAVGSAPGAYRRRARGAQSIRSG